MPVDISDYDEERPSGLRDQRWSAGRADDVLAKEREGLLLGDRWRLDRLVGVGGMAAVYEATHRNGHRAALKVLHPSLSYIPEVRQRFLEESYTANRVNHTGVVTIRDECTLEDGTIFLIMDLLEGGSLEAFHERANCSLSEALRIADAVLDILIAAHSVGVIHRDIKPGNIFMTSDGQVKLLDFGVAWRADAISIDGNFALGTPAFMAPEQARCDWESIDGRTDVWALGATLYLLLTNRHVRSTQTMDEEMVAAMTQPADSVRSIAPSLPSAVVEIVDRALAFDKQDRFPDALSMQLAVRAALRELERSTPPSVPEGLEKSIVLHAAVDLDSSNAALGNPKRLSRYALGLAFGLLLGAGAGALAVGRWRSVIYPLDDTAGVDVEAIVPPDWTPFSATQVRQNSASNVVSPSRQTPPITITDLPREREPESVSTSPARSGGSKPATRKPERPRRTWIEPPVIINNVEPVVPTSTVAEPDPLSRRK
jgi:serine/threonine protein kinase